MDTSRTSSASPAPVALFAYNRPSHTRRTIESLLANELASRSELLVFSDGAKDRSSAAAVEEVRRYLRTVEGFRSIRIYERDSNAGLARSIIEGVTRVIRDHGRVIVLEDDMVTSPWFLTYMNEALEMYGEDENVASVHAYSFPSRTPLPETFFLRGADCWGWATWERSWRHFEPDGRKLLNTLRERRLTRAFDLGGAFGYTQMLEDQVSGRNDSWAIRWHAACFLQERLTLHPGRSLVWNIGTDGSGTHCAETEDYASSLARTPIRVNRIPVRESEHAREEFARFMRSTRKGLLQRILARTMRSMRRGR